MTDENAKKEIGKRLERAIKYHRDKRESIKGLNPAEELKEIGAINALENLWISLIQDGLLESSKLQ